MYYGRSELILDFVINDMSIFGTSLRWNKPATMQFSHGSSYFHKHPRWQMDECLCRHGLNKQQRLPHCKLNLAVCTLVVGMRSKSHQRSESGSLRTLSDLHGHIIILSVRSAALRIQALWTSNYHFRPHRLSSGLWRYGALCFPPLCFDSSAIWEQASIGSWHNLSMFYCDVQACTRSKKETF